MSEKISGFRANTRRENVESSEDVVQKVEALEQKLNRLLEAK